MYGMSGATAAASCQVFVAKMTRSAPVTHAGSSVARTGVTDSPPGAMIFAVSICFNLLSDSLRSAMDIRN